MTIEQDTGSSVVKSKILTLMFQNYVVKVRVGPNDQFLDIVEIGVKKDFLTPEQKANRSRLFNVDDIYEIK